MSSLQFVKAHACGNDFLVIEESAAMGRHAALAKRLCERNTGVGADGIEFLERKPDGTFFLRLFNADGSEAELSGNGTRCVAAWLAQSEGRTEMIFGTHGGVRTCRVLSRDGATWWIESEHGRAARDAARDRDCRRQRSNRRRDGERRQSALRHICVEQ